MRTLLRGGPSRCSTMKVLTKNRWLVELKIKKMTQEPLQTEEVYRVLAKEASLAVFDLGNLGNMDSRLPAVVINQEDC